jgi:hypothetical protein
MQQVWACKYSYISDGFQKQHDPTMSGARKGTKTPFDLVLATKIKTPSLFSFSIQK